MKLIVPFILLSLAWHSGANAQTTSVTVGKSVTTQASRPKLGIYAVNNGDGGVLVQRVDANSPAADAGIKPGDVIIKINSDLIGDAYELAVTVADYKPGEKIVIYYDRRDQPMQATVTLGGVIKQVTTVTVHEKTETAAVRDTASYQSAASYTGDYPATYNDAHTSVVYGKPLGIRGAEAYRGVRVLEVTSGTAADRAGLRTGDIVTRLGNLRITSVNDIDKTMRYAEDRVRMEFIRDGELRAAELEF
ncbi:MAG: PDZ domain-containing protein [Bacteroidota bacterium]